MTEARAEAININIGSQFKASVKSGDVVPKIIIIKKDLSDIDKRHLRTS